MASVLSRYAFRAYQVLVLCVAISLLYVSAPYFLISYYSVWDGDTLYTGAVQHEIGEGEYLLSVKVVTSESVMIKDDGLLLAVYYGLVVYPKDDSDPIDDDDDEPHSRRSGGQGTHTPHDFFPALDGDDEDVPLGGRGNRTVLLLCPKEFYHSDFLRGHCSQMKESELSFLAFDSSYDDLTPGGATFSESPEDIVQKTFTIPRPRVKELEEALESVELNIFILQFQKDSDTCETRSDCAAYAEELRAEDNGLPYMFEDYNCYTPFLPGLEHAELYGCAVPIAIGNTTDCFKDGTLECSFVAFYSMFINPPTLFTWGGIWNWGVIAFINGVFLLIVLQLIQGYIMYADYISKYYFDKNEFTLFENRVYEVKMKVIGEQFTRRSGSFLINDALGAVLFKHDFSVHFPVEDVEDGRVSAVEVRCDFRPTDTTTGAFYEMSWPHQFTEANAVIPVTRVEIRRRIPPTVKTKWNMAFLPILCVYGFISGAHTKISVILVKKYMYLVFYYLAVHFTWFIPVLFTMISLIPWTSESVLNTMFWGTYDRRPPMPIVFFCLFDISLVVGMMLTAFCALPHNPYVGAISKCCRSGTPTASNTPSRLGGEHHVIPEGVVGEEEEDAKEGQRRQRILTLDRWDVDESIDHAEVDYLALGSWRMFPEFEDVDVDEGIGDGFAARPSEDRGASTLARILQFNPEEHIVALPDSSINGVAGDRALADAE